MAAPKFSEIVPQTVKAKELLKRHPHLDLDHEHDLWTLYAGGHHFKPARFILQRPKEMPDVYSDRCATAFYLNYTGEIVSDFVANLFLMDPRIMMEEEKPLKGFYADFVKACNAKRAESLDSFMASRMTRALVHGRSWAWVELPEAAAGAKLQSVADLDSRGLRNAYLIPVNVTDMLDWSRDEDGNFEWCVLYFTFTTRVAPWEPNRRKIHRWVVLTKLGQLVYEAEEQMEMKEGSWTGKAGWAKDADAVLVGGKSSKLGKVPLVEIEVPDALNVGDKLFSPASKVVELDNAIAWAEAQGLFAMPVLQTERDGDVVMGDGYWLRLGINDKYGFLESEGKSLQAAMSTREDLRTEMFRVSHLMAAAMKSQATTAGRSGESKRRDSTPTLKVLDAMGAIMRSSYRALLRMVGERRGEDINDWRIDGFDEFDIEAYGDWLNVQVREDAIDPISETFKRKQAKRRVRRMDRELTPEDLKKIDGEIDAYEFMRPGEGEGGVAPGNVSSRLKQLAESRKKKPTLKAV